MDSIPYTPPKTGQAPDWYVEGMALEVTTMDYPWYKPSRAGNWYTDYKYRPAKELSE